ncbi:MAG: class I SAM-dependent methyltransferase [Nitrospiraceae bacterium]|nr:MAG: class I SAM-dependent methyltransferase [Nitrospiraceae bacterium]
MLTDPEEIRIISAALQKNVRDPNRARAHFDRIFADFFKTVRFRNTRVLDLGPGQYDFGELARQRGAAVHAIDYDPAVIQLGRHKGFTVREGNLEEVKAGDFEEAFDGLFCKYSINAFWFHEAPALAHHVRELVRLIKPGGWSWIAPWNGASEETGLTPKERVEITTVQINEFRNAGFSAYELTEDLSRYYGVHGLTVNRPLFTLNLQAPESVKACIMV